MAEAISPDASLTVGHAYPHPPERVWDAIVSMEFLDGWLKDFKPVPVEEGYGLCFTAVPMLGTPFVGRFEVTFLTVIAPEALKFRLRSLEGPLDMYSTWTIHAVPEGSQLLAVMTGYRPDHPADMRLKYMMAQAWPVLLGELGDILDRRHPGAHCT